MPLTEQERREKRRQLDAARYALHKERMNAETRRYYRKNAARMVARTKEYCQKHPDKKKQWDATYYARNRERIIQRVGQYQKDNPEGANARSKKWRLKNPEFFKKYAKQWADEHPDRVRATARKHYHTKVKFNPQRFQKQKLVRTRRKLRNPNYQKEHYAKYKLTPHGKAAINAASLKRRALKKAATVNLTAITEWLKHIRSKPSAICYYCEKRIPSTDIHIDHIVALANGGAHSVDNLCVSCKHCNSSKGAKPVRAWIRMGQQVLEL